MAGKTYSDLIEKTLRYLTPTQVEQTLQITTNYVAASGTLVVDSTSPAYASAGRPGTVLACGLQLWLVQKDNGSGNLSVIGGFQGSTDANVTASTTSPTATVYVRPKFSRYDISEAINDELLALGSPDNGLGQVLTTDITYVPAFMGYALPATFDNASSKVLEVSYKVPDPSRRFPLIRHGDYRVVRNQSDSVFPNGAGIIVYKKAMAGLPIHVTYLAPFSTLVNLTDNVLTVAGMPVSAQDIVPLGTAIRLAPTREVQRNTMAAQPDPRKATEVPPNAIQASVNALQMQYQARISQERNRLMRAFPEAEGW